MSTTQFPAPVTSIQGDQAFEFPVPDNADTQAVPVPVPYNSETHTQRIARMKAQHAAMAQEIEATQTEAIKAKLAEYAGIQNHFTTNIEATRQEMNRQLNAITDELKALGYTAPNTGSTTAAPTKRAKRGTAGKAAKVRAVRAVTAVTTAPRKSKTAKSTKGTRVRSDESRVKQSATMTARWAAKRAEAGGAAVTA